MDVSLVSRVLWQRRVLRGRERWTQPELAAHQLRQQARLREFAVTRSPFYRRFHTGLEHAPLAELPVLTKSVLMDNFDQIGTDPTLRLADLQEYLERPDAGPTFRRRHWVAATSGSSGRKAIIPSTAAEWAAVIASYGRASEWTGVQAGPAHPVRMAVVSSATPWHHSARVAASVHSPFIATERLDAGWPLDEIVAQLNALRPDVIVAYASMVRTLAAEQVAGRLRVSPRAVNSSSEVLTAEARAMAERAWQVPPFNVYAATETGGVAAECSHHHGMHLFEDLVIPEVVDDACQPVPPGTPGARLLVTVLASRTIPLIRYEMTDRLVLSPEPNRCALPFRLIEAIEGRTDDALILPAARGGTIGVHPVVFHKAMDLLDAEGWQVREDDALLRVLVARPGPGFDPIATGRDVRIALAEAGAVPPPVRVEAVDAVPAGASGKRPLVMAKQHAGGPLRNPGPELSRLG